MSNSEFKGPKIVFENVTKEYPNGVKALDNVNFTIEPGEFVFLMGHSGSGKSSLIKLMMLEERQTSGKITIGKDDLSDIKGGKIPYYRRKIGVVFQDFRIIKSKSVFENVSFAMELTGEKRKEIARKVKLVLGIVGLQRKINEMPDCLSGGEQQRIAIARAIVNVPGLIIADEPTGNLDPKNSVEIMNLLQQINQRGATVVIATHEKELAERMGKRIIMLDHGKADTGDDARVDNGGESDE
ncbi:MAG: cell division ATP-binding protein FtsE [Ruminococcaceae bacterium]|nr:cell division ATP-binding protein FtsE [Oscillospiraceae bacterium]